MTVNPKQKLKTMPIMPMKPMGMTPEDKQKLKEDSQKVRKQILRKQRQNRSR